MTEAVPFGVGWSGIVGGAVGCAIAVGSFAWLYKIREWRKEQRKERAPQPEKILRPAGYSALVRMEELWEKIDFAVLQIIGTSVVGGVGVGVLFPVVAGLVLGRFSLGGLLAADRSYLLLSILLFGIGTVLWGIRQLVSAARLYDEARNWRLGLRGEQAVAEKLADRELAAAGYVAFHDLPAEKGKKKWNVDHVVVGPGGVFVLETKARPRRKAKWEQEENVVVFDGKVLRFPWCYDDRAVRQVEFNAKWVRQYLGEYAPKDLLIRPVIVVPGWYVPPTDEAYSVKVMNAKYLVDYIKGSKPVYSREDLKTVVRRLDDGCRTLEF